MTKTLCPPTPSDAGATRLARRPRRVTRSRVSACATQGWRGTCATPAGWDSSASHPTVAEVQDFGNQPPFLDA